MFTDILKDKTAELHSKAEKTIFMQELFSGSLPIEKYLIYLMSLEKIYGRLELEIRDSIDSEIVLSLFDSRLERSFKISKDIKAIGIKSVLPKSVIDSVNEYVWSIKNSSEIDLAAHHYIRYMGDISGGQILSKILQKSYGFTENQISFYKFDIDVNEYRLKYKENINDIVKSKSDQEDFIDTANTIYELTINLLDNIMAS